MFNTSYMRKYFDIAEMSNSDCKVQISQVTSFSDHAMFKESLQNQTERNLEDIYPPLFEDDQLILKILSILS